MTWIKTVSMEEDERVKKAMLDQRTLYPRGVLPHRCRPSIMGSNAGISRVALADSRCAVPFLQRVWRDDVAGVAAERGGSTR